MSYQVLPVDLQQLFQRQNDRISRLELAYNGPQVTADTALSSATTASSTASSAAAAAAAAQALAATCIVRDSYNIFNASNQLTAINGNGITVYAGSSPTSGARVVLNSAGLAGVNSSGVTTFAINASTGNVSMLGSITSGSTITGASFTNTYFTVDVLGNINATSGTIGGFTLSSTGFSTSGPLIYMNSSTGSVYGTTVNAGSGGMDCAGALIVNGSATLASLISTTTSSSANVYTNASTGLMARSTSSARYKVDITPQAIDFSTLMSLTPKSFIDKGEYTANNNSANGLKRYLGLIAEEVAQIPTLKDFLVAYDGQGQPDSINYDRVAVAMIPLLQDLQNRVTKLEGK